MIRRPRAVEIEDARDLLGCGKRHELHAILEAAGLNQAMKDFRLKPRDDLREVGRIQQAIWRGPRFAMGSRRIPAFSVKKQS